MPSVWWIVTVGIQGYPLHLNHAHHPQWIACTWAFIVTQEANDPWLSLSVRLRSEKRGILMGLGMVERAPLRYPERGPFMNPERLCGWWN